MAGKESDGGLHTPNQKATPVKRIFKRKSWVMQKVARRYLEEDFVADFFRRGADEREWRLAEVILFGAGWRYFEGFLLAWERSWENGRDREDILGRGNGAFETLLAGDLSETSFLGRQVLRRRESIFW